MKDWVDTAIRKDVIAAQELLHKYCTYRNAECHRDDMPDCPFRGTNDRNKFAYHYCTLDNIPIHWTKPEEETK